MGNPYLAELRIVSFSYAPKGWALCNGQILAINQNQALFALLGTTYGGNGVNTFALPDLQGAAAMHVSPTHPLGERSGEDYHTLTENELAQHAHLVRAGTSRGNSMSPAGRAWAGSGSLDLYSTTADTVVGDSAVTSVGGSQAHSNQPPYLVLNVIIALQGIFPPRN